MRKLFLLLLVAISLLASGCSSAADKANENIDKAADNFEVPRRVTIINGITDNTLLEVTGFCSVKDEEGTFFVACKNPDGTITRSSSILSDNVTATVVQLQGVEVDLFRSRFLIRPETVIPNFDLSTSNDVPKGK